jgi:hypothetical protein
MDLTIILFSADVGILCHHTHSGSATNLASHPMDSKGFIISGTLVATFIHLFINPVDQDTLIQDMSFCSIHYQSTVVFIL